MAWTLTRSRRGRYTAGSGHRLARHRHCPILCPTPASPSSSPPRMKKGSSARSSTRCKPYADEVLVVDGHSQDRTRDDRRSSTARASSRTTAAARARRCGSRSTPRPPASSSSSTPTARTIRKDIPALVAPIKAGQADLVIGSRGKGGSDELHGTLEQFIRYVGSQLIMLGDQLPLERPADRQPERLPRHPPRRRPASSA